jgi:Homeodomain-like domain
VYFVGQVTKMTEQTNKNQASSIRAMAAAMRRDLGPVGTSKSSVARITYGTRKLSDNLRVVGLDGRNYPASRWAHERSVTFALHMHADGRPNAEIGALLGVSERTVRRWLQRYTLVPGRPSGRGD